MTVCKEPDCSGAVLARGWCRKHYVRWRRHGDPTIKLTRWGEDSNAEVKFCRYCKRDLPVSFFYRRNDTSGLVYKCKDCWKPAPGQIREKDLWYRYRLTPGDYEKLLTDQDGRCAICRQVSELEVDHDHACCPGRRSCGKCIRGLLCSLCNRILGMANDSPVVLVKAATYLGRHNSPASEYIP